MDLRGTFPGVANLLILFQVSMNHRLTKEPRTTSKVLQATLALVKVKESGHKLHQLKSTKVELTNKRTLYNQLNMVAVV